MKDDANIESSAAVPEDAPRPKKSRAKKSAGDEPEERAAARGGRTAKAKPRKAAAKNRKTEPAPKAAPKKKSAAKRKSGTAEKTKGASQPQISAFPIEDPIGDVSDGEAWTYTGEAAQTEAESEIEAYRADAAADAVDGTPDMPTWGSQTDADEPQTEPPKAAKEVPKGSEQESQTAVRPPAKLERLQKILSQAGVASRRHAEEMIVAGRVAVNGQVVTTLGSKADPERDHIRVDGKLLHGAERHRYFVLNKPKGYVTTVSDPEGRPTVMDFVHKLGARIYPVGRLDFQSEGLLLMTNDGALANQLTHASSGVEKTYLVKISGQPDEEELERLRKGVMIERGGPSSSGLYGPGGRVRTAPAQIRQIRPGENPWYEVVLTEGRNREIRKMFAAIGHYAEKIRRVGYGPLALDVEPGKLRELTQEEVDALRQVAEGKLKPRRLKTELMLPKDAGRTTESRLPRKGNWRSSDARSGKPNAKSRPERGRSDEFRRRGEGGSGPRTGSGFASKIGSGPGSGRETQRNFRANRREWQPRPREERPVRGKSDEPQRGFVHRGKSQTGKSGFAGRNEAQINKSEEREFRKRPIRPGAGWQSETTQKPFRSEGRSAPRVGGKSRPGAAQKFAPKGRSGNRYPQRGKPEQTGREHFSGERGGGRDRFSSTRKPEGFRAGSQRGGRRTGRKSNG